MKMKRYHINRTIDRDLVKRELTKITPADCLMEERMDNVSVFVSDEFYSSIVFGPASFVVCMHCGESRTDFTVFTSGIGEPSFLPNCTAESLHRTLKKTLKKVCNSVD